jgi:hypothetical protein
MLHKMNMIINNIAIVRVLESPKLRERGVGKELGRARVSETA